MTDDTPLPLSIVIVSYNSRDMTLEAIRSAFTATTTPFEMIVLDNASRDGSAEAIANQFPEVKLIASSENLGFALGNNVAAKQARGERLLLLNPDTVVLDGAVDRLLAFADRTPNAGIWGGRTLFADGTLNRTSCWGRMTLWTLACRAFGLTWLFPNSALFCGEALGGWARDSEREVDIVTGCFLLIDRSLWQRLEGFNPDFFMYGEEADLCARAQRLGARPRITPEATIIHHGGGTEASAADKLLKVMKGKVTLMNVHWSPPARVIGRWLFLITAALRAAGNRYFKPRTVRGKGQDGHTDSWPSLWLRRAEWIDGWPTTRSGPGSLG